MQEHIYSSSVRSRYPDVQLVLGCGDLPFYYLEFVRTMLNVPVLYVRGNHDDRPYYTADGRTVTRAGGCDDIDGHVVYRSGLIIAGIEGSIRYRSSGKCMYSDHEIAVKLLQMIPKLLFNKVRYGRYLDVLITHAPPYGIHDRDDLAHTGFRAFLPFMRRFQPRFLLHGHVHLYGPSRQARSQYHNTTVINVYPCTRLDIPIH
ncbi:MAG: metallophosphoesterase [Chloroflexota bacterium]